MRYICLIGLILLMPVMTTAAETASSDLLSKVVEGNNSFAMSLYGKFKDREGNLFYSPYSLSSALAMTYNGAQGTTQEQMQKALNFPENIADLNKAFFSLNQIFVDHQSEASEDFGLIVSNSLWEQQGHPFLPKFLDDLTKYYKSVARLVDFSGNPDGARTDINRWVRQQTQGKIADLLQPSDIKSSTRLVLVSAIRMKAKWAHPFEEDKTIQAPFFPKIGKTISVPTMTNTVSFPIVQGEEYDILEMPYKLRPNSRANLVMWVLLPREADQLSSIEGNLGEFNIKNVSAKMKNERVTVAFPKFNLTDTLHFNDVLASMGMPEAFTDKADFSGMTGSKDLSISSVVQKAYIEVNEEGSEAGAATAVTMNLTSALEPKPPIMFQANHPFLIFILEKETGAILFMGRVTEPRG